jgi:hypothetical protein
MPFGSLPARRKFVVQAAGSLLAALLAPGAGVAGESQPPGSEPGSGRPRRPRVPQPRLELAPAAIEVAPGSRVQFIARASGGEAILFSVKWSIREGTAGGTIVPAHKRQDDGSYTAVYQAPTAGSGPFHVIATLHEFPAAAAEASVRVRAPR